jgi:hypothetical protein
MLRQGFLKAYDLMGKPTTTFPDHFRREWNYGVNNGLGFSITALLNPGLSIKHKIFLCGHAS